MPAELVWQGILASLLAGLATGVGALGVLFLRRLTERQEGTLLSLAAGIMLAASFFSLLLPALAQAEGQLGSKLPAVLIVIFGLLCGAAALALMHRLAPHEHFIAGREGPDATNIGRIWLFVIAITIHNFPEGMSVGVGFAGGAANGTALALGIGIQNVPEGLAVAVSLLAAGYGPGRAFLVGLLSGLVEPVGGVVGSLAAWLAAPALPWTMGFAAGAMLFVISDEIIPETHRKGLANLATAWLMAGFALMMFLDATLG